MGLLDKAKAKKPATKAAKKDDKITVTVTDPEFSQALKDFAVLDSEIKDKTAKLEIAKGVVKEHGIEEFAKLYDMEGINVGSFNMKNEDGDSVMFLPTDKYIKLDDEMASALKEEYGDDIVEETTVYSFKNALLEKYYDQISEMLEKADFMTAEEKENLIEATTTITVKKGTIDKVKTLATKAKTSCKAVLTNIQPVYMSKGAKLAK